MERFWKHTLVETTREPKQIEVRDSGYCGCYVKCGPKDDVATQTVAGMPHNRPCDIARIIPATSTQMGAMPSCLACVESLKTCRRDRNLVGITGGTPTIAVTKHTAKARRSEQTPITTMS